MSEEEQDGLLSKTLPQNFLKILDFPNLLRTFQDNKPNPNAFLVIPDENGGEFRITTKDILLYRQEIKKLRTKNKKLKKRIKYMKSTALEQ